MYTDTKSKVAAIISYLAWLCWVIAFIIRDKDDALSRRHLNQGFTLSVIGSAASLVTRLHGIFATVGFIVDLGVLILSIIGIVRAARGSGEPLPIVGDIQLF